MVEYQYSPFEPVRSFDTLGIAINQLLDERMTGEGLMDLAIPEQDESC